MTYRELRAFLNTLSDKQLNMDVTIQNPLDIEQFFAAYAATDIDEADGILDDNHPVICPY